MKTSDINTKNDTELSEELEALYKERFGLGMQKAVGQLSRSHRVREVRRDIARIQTVMNERKTAAKA